MSKGAALGETTGHDDSLRVDVVDSLSGLAEHADAWDGLALSVPERIPQTSHAWVASYLEHCNPESRRWYCLFAYRGSRLVGVLPVLRTRRWGRASMLCPEDAHTDNGHPLLAPDGAAETLDGLLRALDDLEPGLWLRCFRVREGSPLLSAVGARPSDLVLRPLVGAGRFADTTGTWEGFEKQLSKSFRRTLRSARRKAQAEHRVRFEVVGGEEAARPDLLEHFLRIEASGWKGEAGTAIACDPERVAFYTTLTRRLAARGWLEWNLLRFDDAVVAAHLGIRLGTSLTLPKAAYDAALARFSPGHLLDREVFARAFADQTVEVNWLTDAPWMHVWPMDRTDYHDLVLVSPRPGLGQLTSWIEAAEPRQRFSDVVAERPWLHAALARVRRIVR